MSILNSLKIWWKGRSGEKQISDINKLLSPSEFLIINGLTLENNEKSINNGAAPTTQIDHCIFSLKTGALFVVETKNVTGVITGDVSDKNWVLHNEKRSLTIGNYLRQNYAHIKSVQDKLRDFGYAVPNEKIHSLVFILKDKHGSKHQITDEKQKNETGFTSHWFKTDCIATNSVEYLDFITNKTHEMALKIEQNPKLQTNPMIVRQQFNVLKDNNEDGLFATLKHIDNVKQKQTQKKRFTI